MKVQIASLILPYLSYLAQHLRAPTATPWGAEPSSRLSTALAMSAPSLRPQMQTSARPDGTCCSSSMVLPLRILSGLGLEAIRHDSATGRTLLDSLCLEYEKIRGPCFQRT